MERPSISYADKFVAFVDVLGFSDLVRQSEAKTEGAPRLEDLVILVEKLGARGESERLARSGPHVCPGAPFIAQDLAFRVTQVSDSVVISSEVSPAGVIHLVHKCFGICIELLESGHLCRGFITRGEIFHSERHFIGTGYLKAVAGEKKVSIFQASSAEIGTPFVEIDTSVSRFVEEQGDGCVKTMFRRMTESDGTFTAISPFGALKKIPSTIIDSNFDPLQWKEKILISRSHILSLIAQLENVAPNASEKGLAKISHYKRKLNEVLDVKNRELIDMDQLAVKFRHKSS
jgi:hypothetical protein